MSTLFGYYGLTMGLIVKSSAKTAEDLDGCFRGINHDMGKVPRKSTGFITDSYKVEKQAHQIQVWKLDAKGNKVKIVMIVND